MNEPKFSKFAGVQAPGTTLYHVLMRGVGESEQRLQNPVSSGWYQPQGPNGFLWTPKSDHFSPPDTAPEL